ncbi:hypothetical protein J437_LFUL003631 [Ladona fulva]|uniref:Uncharacterized protein n=1 Tax=Ladona fulva TaxID=123851 RepID=A0A8K0JXP3_LADFU|nr:hypothetical protein J437_LFUL003631 [Ladona fulva]
MDKNELFKYFEVKRRRDTELAKVDIASLFVPRSKAPELNLAKVVRKAIAEIKSQKETEENLSQINLIETRKKLQLEDKYNALIRAEGMLTLYVPPAHTPPPQQPPPPTPPPPSPPPIPVRRPTRGRPPKRRYFRGRWRGYRGGRGTAPSVSQTRGMALPSGSSIQPRNPVGRPRRGRPISRRIVTRGSLSLPASAETSVTLVVEPTTMPVVENVTRVVKNPMVKANELTPKRKAKNVVPPITSASPDTVRNLIATITAPKVLEKKVPDESDKTSVPEEEINSAKSASLESSSDEAKKQDEEKANGQVNALLWKESFSKVKVTTENPLPPTKDKVVDPKERMKKIIAESQEKLLQKLSCVPNSSKNLTSWSINPPSPPSDSVC